VIVCSNHLSSSNLCCFAVCFFERFAQVWTEESGRNRGYCKWKYVGCDKAGEVVEMVSSGIGVTLSVATAAAHPTRASVSVSNVTSSYRKMLS
jgi:hypothetical protein